MLSKSSVRPYSQNTYRYEFSSYSFLFLTKSILRLEKYEKS